MLSTLDTVSSPLTTITAGPFAIFQTELNLRHDLRERSHSSHVETEPAPASSPSTTFAKPPDGENDQVQSDVSVPDLPTQLESLPLDSDASQLIWECQEQYAGDISMAALLAELDDASANDEPISSLLDHSTSSFIPLSPYLGLSMPLFHDSDTSMLMYHYMNHVAELLQPVLHPQNPWRTTYFRFALEGCSDAASRQTSLSLSTSKVSTAIFHGVLSSAAFHLRNATVDSNKYHKLGLQHRAKALQALNAALALPQDSQLYTVYLTAMLSLVTIDVRPRPILTFPCDMI